MTTCLSYKEGLRALSTDIAALAKPSSAIRSFDAYSSASPHPAHIGVRAPRSHFIADHKSDLDRWREIFQLYVETEIFESHREASRGENSIEESECRLALFMDRLGHQGLLDGKKFRMKASHQALGRFLQMNMFLLNMKKVRLSGRSRRRLTSH